MTKAAPLPSSELVALSEEARGRMLDLVADLSDQQMFGRKLAIVNPVLWEIGHVAWFQEKWVLRHWNASEPLLPDGDALYDSARVHHDTRWDLPLPSRQGTLDYMRRVLDGVRQALESKEPGPEGTYFALLALLHEYMHAEALAYTRQTFSYPAPNFSGRTTAGEGAAATGEAVSGDVEIPGGRFQLGATRDAPFVFDNEKWAHPVEIAPFSIARAPVTQEEFASFVDDGGYERQELWSRQGWIWRQGEDARHPLYWRREGGEGWRRRDFDRWVALEPRRPVIHLSWYEAEAYCRWAGRRLPTEAEWEAAASAESAGNGSMLAGTKRRYPWGDHPPSPARANLDWDALGCVSVDALPEGDSFFGCRQMVGNVWEWTSSDFQPYPGFLPDPYREYSEPWFHGHKVLRGGCWTTRSRLIRNTWRNFYPPHRRDVWAGLRTCAL